MARDRRLSRSACIRSIRGTAVRPCHQRASERTVVARGGVWNLVWTAWAAVGAVVWGRGRVRTVLVNASAVVGLRDDEEAGDSGEYL